MVVGLARHDIEIPGLHARRERLRVRNDLFTIVSETGQQSLFERDGLARNHMHQRTALQSGKDRAVDLFRPVRVAQNESAAWASQRLVGRRRHDLCFAYGRRVDTRSDQPRDMSDIREEQCIDLVRDRAEGIEIDDAGIGGGATLDHLRPMLEGERSDPVVVDPLILLGNSIGHDLEMFAGEIDWAAVGQMPSVIEIHREDGIAAIEHGFIDSGVCLRPGVRLDIGMFGTE